jgi:hypothetical protein
MSEADCRQHIVEQLRTNDRSLLDKLADADANANVVTAVLNVEEFLAHLIRRFPKVVDAVLANGETPAGAATAERPAAGDVTAALSEGEFMDLVLQQLETGERAPIFRIADDKWQQADDEAFGEDLARYPFLY